MIKKLMAIGVLALIDQGSKIIIWNTSMGAKHPIINSILFFKPVINTKLSWLSVITGIEMPMIIHLIIMLLFTVLILGIYDFAITQFNIKRESFVF